MHKIEFYNLKSNNRYAILQVRACKRDVYTLQTGDSKTTSYYNIVRHDSSDNKKSEDDAGTSIRQKLAKKDLPKEMIKFINDS